MVSHFPPARVRSLPLQDVLNYGLPILMHGHPTLPGTFRTPPAMDGSCLFVSRLYFRAQRRQCASCKAVAAASSWALPRQLFHNAQNHPRILCVLASSRSEEATRKSGIEESLQRPGRQTVDMQEIDALAAASGSAKSFALGRKYSRCVNGAAPRPVPSGGPVPVGGHTLWLATKHHHAAAGQV